MLQSQTFWCVYLICHKAVCVFQHSTAFSMFCCCLFSIEPSIYMIFFKHSLPIYFNRNIKISICSMFYATCTFNTAYMVWSMYKHADHTDLTDKVLVISQILNFCSQNWDCVWYKNATSVDILSCLSSFLLLSLVVVVLLLLFWLSLLLSNLYNYDYHHCYVYHQYYHYCQYCYYSL